MQRRRIITFNTKYAVAVAQSGHCRAICFVGLDPSSQIIQHCFVKAIARLLIGGSSLRLIQIVVWRSAMSSPAGFGQSPGRKSILGIILRSGNVSGGSYLHNTVWYCILMHRHAEFVPPAAASGASY